MERYKYLIVGGGMTADAAVSGIREADTGGTIGLLCSEEDAPYNRPPLSKGLWKGEAPDSIWRGTEKQGVTLHLGRKAVALDSTNKKVTDDHGAIFSFEKLLLATGATPRQLLFDDDSIIYYRTVKDYQHLRALAEKGGRFAVIGGGFIGWEIAAALAMSGKEVVMLFPGEAIGGHIYPVELARFLNEFYRQKGVNVVPGSPVVGLGKSPKGTVVKTKSQGEFLVDGVVAGIGVTPNIELARLAGLEVENGIVVDELLRTTNLDIHAAGDVANFFNPALGRRLRVEHEDNANTMGRAAGRAMAGMAAPYHHLPFFYSDLFDLGYEAVGELDSRLETVADWKEPYREGVVYYLRDGRVCGVLLWNVWGQVDSARELIAAPGPFRPTDLKGCLPKG
ncbi:MAG: FAD-dependent oxidoreductase [Terriglobia bacterium]|jgi:3-phenylpropionate/trans-cinnamate dioxygenase ferredoxin reductase component